MTDSLEKYSQYTVQQLVLDDKFIAWVKEATEEDSRFWESYLLAYPSQQDNVRLAKQLVLAISTERDTVEPQTKDRLWAAIKQEAGKEAPVVKMRTSRWWIAAAAAVLIILLGVLFFRSFSEKDTELIQTAYAEKRTITLPDHSTVVLNAASKIEFNKEWRGEAPREVWVEGEAFFDVVHINKAGTEVKPSERFIVHLKNVDVEVLGTTFTVNTRRNAEQVVLQTGSVKVALKKTKQEVLLKPGEMLRYSGADSVKKEVTAAVEHSSWKENVLTFSNTPVVDIAELIEDNYGYQVKIIDSSLLNRTFNGRLSSENEQILFKALETMMDVKIVVQGKTVTISKN